jgi:hypothetical protein
MESEKEQASFTVPVGVVLDVVCCVAVGCRLFSDCVMFFETTLKRGRIQLRGFATQTTPLMKADLLTCAQRISRRGGEGGSVEQRDR